MHFTLCILFLAPVTSVQVTGLCQEQNSEADIKLESLEREVRTLGANPQKLYTPCGEHDSDSDGATTKEKIEILEQWLLKNLESLEKKVKKLEGNLKELYTYDVLTDDKEKKNANKVYKSHTATTTQEKIKILKQWLVLQPLEKKVRDRERDPKTLYYSHYYDIEYESSANTVFAHNIQEKIEILEQWLEAISELGIGSRDLVTLDHKKQLESIESDLSNLTSTRYVDLPLRKLKWLGATETAFKELLKKGNDSAAARDGIFTALHQKLRNETWERRNLELMWETLLKRSNNAKSLAIGQKEETGNLLEKIGKSYVSQTVFDYLPSDHKLQLQGVSRKNYNERSFGFNADRVDLPLDKQEGFPQKYVRKFAWAKKAYVILDQNKEPTKWLEVPDDKSYPYRIAGSLRLLGTKEVDSRDDCVKECNLTPGCNLVEVKKVESDSFSQGDDSQGDDSRVEMQYFQKNKRTCNLRYLSSKKAEVPPYSKDSQFYWTAEPNIHVDWSEEDEGDADDDEYIINATREDGVRAFVIGITNGWW